MTRRLLFRSALAALLPAVAVLAGCQHPHPPGQLVVASKSTLASVDPIDITGIAGLQLLSAIGDPLYATGADGQLQPRLAAAPPQISPDGRTARIPLRRDVLFHDGSRFDAAAMVFSLERFRSLAKMGYLLDDRISGVRASGPYELELRLKRPYSALPALLSSISLTPLSPKAYQQHRNRSLADRFVGTGPYRLVSSTPQKQTLLPFARYWGPPPRNSGIHLVTLSNSTALFGALVSGEVDVLMSSGIESDQQRALAQRAQEGRLVEGIGPAGEIGYLTLLSDRPPFDQAPLRQAVALSLNRELISQRVSYGIRAPLRSLVPPPLAGSTPPAWPAYNPARAREIYQQAGYCRGRRFTLPLTFRSNVPADKLFALTWKAQLERDLGDCVQLEVTGVESTTAYRQVADGAFPMIFFDWNADFPDPDIYLAPMLACSKAKGGQCLEGNAAAAGSFWSAPGLQAELQASERLTGTARLPLLRQLQQRAAAGAAYIPVWQVAPRAWAQPSLQRPVFDGSGRLVLQALSVR